MNRMDSVFVALSVTVVSVAVRAESVSLAPAKDNTLIQHATGALSNGAGQYLFAGRTNQLPEDSRRRALLQFDVAGSIPSRATINSVTLTMNMSRTIEGAAIVSLHRASADWGEGTSDALP